jgi:signal transduction histidine kinase
MISVNDTGQGIPENIQKKIFDPFFTTKDVGKGTGLGLPSVYGTIKEHFGHIDFTSIQGKGTEFRLFLPLGKADP